jgi:hypothetical protein
MTTFCFGVHTAIQVHAYRYPVVVLLANGLNFIRFEYGMNRKGKRRLCCDLILKFLKKPLTLLALKMFHVIPPMPAVQVFKNGRSLCVLQM